MTALLPQHRAPQTVGLSGRFPEPGLETPPAGPASSQHSGAAAPAVALSGPCDASDLRVPFLTQTEPRALHLAGLLPGEQVVTRVPA